jgi:hypothetical protein
VAGRDHQFSQMAGKRVTGGGDQTRELTSTPSMKRCLRRTVSGLDDHLARPTPSCPWRSSVARGTPRSLAS